ncbi:RimK family alpha-L-glutamate ligase [Candidatus Peregrinibacteria bacterium]|nr:RimK family alpha-L-glutamate ligase [Candidatus Peregrinibacteria bacterium]
MNIGILSYTSTRRKLNSRRRTLAERYLIDAVKKRGHKPVFLRSDKCELSYADGKMKVLYGGKKFPDLDVIIPRPSISINVDLKLTLNKHLLLMGMPLVNGYMPILRAKNKIRTLQIMSHGGIKVPKTVVLERLEYIDNAVKRVGGYPVILKTVAGSLGKGVVIVESKRSMLSALDMILTQDHWKILLIQEYVAEAEGKDVRVFIVDGKVVASMERSAAEGDFRSNLHAGGQGVVGHLTEAEEKISLDAAKALKLDLAGVDLLRAKNGPMVMEVNANPGLEGITAVTGVDVAGAIVDFAIQKVGGAPPQSQCFRGCLDGAQSKKTPLSKESLLMDEPHAVV